MMWRCQTGAVLRILAAWCVFTATATADLAVTFDIQPRALRVGEAAACSITVRNTDNPATPGLPPIDGIQVAGPNVSRSSNVQFINGKIQTDSAVTYTYQLMPLRAGSFTIGPFRYSTGGETVDLPAIAIEVVDPSAGPVSGSSQPASRQPAMFAKLVAERTEVYSQQIFNLDILVYYRGINLDAQAELLNMPSGGIRFEQFVQEDAGRQVVGNDLYDVRRFRTKAQALTAGTFTLDPSLRMHAITQRARQRRGPFDDPFFGFFNEGYQTQPVEVTPEPLVLTVRPLPEEGRPPSFSGAVGQFNFDVDVKPTELAVGEPITLTVRIAGRGNIESVSAPEMAALDQFRMYDSRLVGREVNSSESTGIKTFEQVLLPKSESAASIPILSFSYFDPVAGEYRTLSRGPFALTLHPSSNASTPLVQGAATRPQAQVIGTDIVYLKPAPDRWMRLDEQAWYLRRRFAAVQSIPLLCAIGLWIAVRRRKDLERDVAKARRQKAPRSARAGLRKAEGALAAANVTGFYEGAWEALSSYFANRLNLSPGEITSERVITVLDQRGLAAADCARLRDLLARCEQARFSHAGREAAGPAVLQGDLEELRRLLKSCERIRM